MAQQITFRTYLNTRYGPDITRNFRNLELIYKKLAKIENDLTFLSKCKYFNLMPKGLQLKAPYESRRCKNILYRAELAMLRDLIQICRAKKNQLNIAINNIQSYLYNRTIQLDFNHIMDSINFSYSKTKTIIKNKQINKFQILLNSSQSEHVVTTHNNLQKDNFLKKTIINLSNRVLTKEETNVLSKGMNFAVRDQKFNKIDFILAIEDTAKKLPLIAANEFRIKNKMILEKPIKITPNLDKEELLAIKSLKSDKTIKILPADKGNATVIIDLNVYKTKIDDLISGGQYTKLPKDPTSSIENKIYRTLLKHKNEFTNLERHLLTPHNSKPPHFYGLPKIHKPEVPFRPLISSINSPCHKLARFLLKILNPISGNSETYIKNTPDFLEKLNNIEIKNNEILVSFDVVSLFTNVPVDKTLLIIKNRLNNDQRLIERTKLSVETIMELLTICIKTTYFQLNDEFYQQNSGMAMGSPLSPILSNIFMEELESDILTNSIIKPRIWLRFVDDIFAIWSNNKTELDNFLNHINTKEPTIKFTLEVEQNSELPFLDVLIKKSNNTYETYVYKKPTHTGRYLNFNSNHQNSIKRGIIKSLYDRAKIICSDNEKFLSEKNQIKSTLILNNYPEHFIDSTFLSIEQNQNKQKGNENNINNPIISTIPYIPGISDKIKRISQKYNIKTVFRTTKTLRSILTKTKPFNHQQFTKDVVYKIPCECNKSYIGETGRPLECRLKEHKNNVRTYDQNSKIAQHVIETGHEILWNDTKILDRECSSTKRKLKEAMYIEISGNDCFSQNTVDFDKCWLNILKVELRK